MRRTRQQQEEFDFGLRVFERYGADPSEENFCAVIEYISGYDERTNSFGVCRHMRYGEVVFHFDQSAREWLGFTNRLDYGRYLLGRGVGNQES